MQACKEAPTTTPVTTAEAPATTSASVSSVQECPMCGTINKSGKRSCCARGGAWFKKCGDVGDSSFGHTWDEGFKACKKAPATTSASVSSVQECPKCGTISKSGKRSCCARGGAWFKKCGD